MSTRRVDPTKSRIVLVGTPAYADVSLNDVPAIANNITDLVDVFTDPGLGGFNTAHCLVAPPDADLAQVGELLARAAAEAEDLLLFYYAGHGLLSARRRDLYLSLAGTRPEQLAFTALAFESVRDVCLGTRAKSRVVILDCCYSGRALPPTLGDEVIGQLEVDGTYTLTAASANRVALVLEGERHTAFTEQLLHVLRDGVSDSGPLLSMGDIYRQLHARLRAKGLPTPQQCNTATADLLALTLNPRFCAPAPNPLPVTSTLEEISSRVDGHSSIFDIAAAIENVGLPSDPRTRRTLGLEMLREIADADQPTVAEDDVNTPADHRSVPAVPPKSTDRAHPPSWPSLPAVTNRQRAATILGVAGQVASSIGKEPFRARALADVSQAVATIDADWAYSLASEAEQAARSVTNTRSKAQALSYVAVAVASADPDRAERIAWGVTDETLKARALAFAAVAVADPDRASRLAGEAEHTARAIAHDLSKAQALADVARAMARADPARASRLAGEAELAVRGIARNMSPHTLDGLSIAQMLAGIAGTVAEADPDRAERIARGITNVVPKAQALADVARAVAGADPARASRLAGEAEQATWDITNKALKARALAVTAKAIAVADYNRADRLVGEVQRILQSSKAIGDRSVKGQVLAELAGAVAVADPDRAELIARKIAVKSWKPWALAYVAGAVAAADPDRAEQIAGDIANEWWKVQTLAKIAGIWIAPPVA